MKRTGSSVAVIFLSGLILWSPFSVSVVNGADPVAKNTAEAENSSTVIPQVDPTSPDLPDPATYQLTTDYKTNDKSEQIKFLQKKLYLLGYYTSVVTGKLDATTLSALKVFRVENQLSGTGVDKSLRAKLNSL